MVANNSTLYSKKYNFEFYNIHKNGQTSIIKTFNLEWVPINNLPKDRKIICIIRDPIDRIISSYFYLKSKHKKANIQLNYNLSKIIKSKNNSEGLNILVNEIKNKGFFDDHILPQVYFLNNKLKTEFKKYPHSADRNIDAVTHFIDIKNMKQKLKNMFGVDILHANSTKDKSLNFNIINESTIKLIKEIYAEDFKLYDNVKS